MPLLQSSFTKHPLAVIALSAVAGVLVADHVGGASWIWFAGATLLLGFALWRASAASVIAATGLVFGFIHLVCLSNARDHPLRSLLKPGEKVTAVLHGTFLRAPMVREDDPARRQASFQVSAIELPTRGKCVTGTAELRVWLDDPLFDPRGGEYRLEGALTLTPRAWNPTLFDPIVMALQQGIIGDFTLHHATSEHGESFSPWLAMLHTAERSRDWIAQQVTRGIEDDAIPSTVITTMALGTSDSRATEIAEPFRQTGTLHIFAVSGLHVSLLAVIGWALLRPFGLGRKRALAILIPALFGYAFITGWAPSAARAAWMSAIMLAGPLLNRRARVLNNLGAAALVILASDTLQMFQPGFQLSFIVLAVIALAAGPLTSRFKAWSSLDPFLPPTVADASQRFGAWTRRWLVGTLCTSTVAWLGSLPLMIAHFHSCTPIAIVANGVLVPLSSLALLIVVLSMLFGLTGLHSLQELLNNSNWAIAKLMMLCSTWFAAIPGGNFALSTDSLRAKPAFSLTVLAMPPGEAAQLLASEDQHWLLDCGHDKSFRRNVQAFLQHDEIVRIDALVLSHADIQHIGAAPALLALNPLAATFVGPHEPWRLDSRATAMWQTVHWLEAHHREPLRLVEDDAIHEGHSTLHVLYPRLSDVHDKADDRSLVVRIDHGPFRILWCNDAGFITEKVLLDRCAPSDLRCDVIVRNQHVADYSALSEFLLAVRPRAIVSSNAPAIAEECLPPKLRAHCAARGIALFDQHETGCVRIEEVSGKLRVSAWLTGQRIELDPEP